MIFNQPHDTEVSDDQYYDRYDNVSDHRHLNDDTDRNAHQEGSVPRWTSSTWCLEAGWEEWEEVTFIIIKLTIVIFLGILRGFNPQQHIRLYDCPLYYIWKSKIIIIILKINASNFDVQTKAIIRGSWRWEELQQNKADGSQVGGDAGRTLQWKGLL